MDWINVSVDGLPNIKLDSEAFGYNHTDSLNLNIDVLHLFASKIPVSLGIPMDTFSITFISSHPVPDRGVMYVQFLGCISNC
jgi:ABC-type microcin C transport system permease subunit YejB